MDTIDIPGAYFRTDLDEEIIMILKGILEDLLVNIYHNIYSKYAVSEKVIKILCVKLQNYLYMLLRSALLFYLKLPTHLENNRLS